MLRAALWYPVDVDAVHSSSAGNGYGIGDVGDADIIQLIGDRKPGYGSVLTCSHSIMPFVANSICDNRLSRMRIPSGC